MLGGGGGRRACLPLAPRPDFAGRARRDFCVRGDVQPRGPVFLKVMFIFRAWEREGEGRERNIPGLPPRPQPATWPLAQAGAPVCGRAVRAGRSPPGHSPTVCSESSVKPRRAPVPRLPQHLETPGGPVRAAPNTRPLGAPWVSLAVLPSSAQCDGLPWAAAAVPWTLRAAPPPALGIPGASSYPECFRDGLAAFPGRARRFGG